MKKNVIALMCLLALGLVACGNKSVENEEIPTVAPEGVVDFDNMEDFVVGEEIGNSGIIWGEGVGGLGTQTPTTDGYSDGTTITIEPVN